MKTTQPTKATKDELRFIASLEEGLKYARGLKSKGVIVERHPLRATKEDIKGFRTRLHLSQAQCALVLDVDVETIKKWEQGKNQVPGPVSLWIRAYADEPSLVAKLLKGQLQNMLQFA
jgi:putative transcriptional regulator